MNTYHLFTETCDSYCIHSVMKILTQVTEALKDLIFLLLSYVPRNLLTLWGNLIFRTTYD